MRRLAWGLVVLGLSSSASAQTGGSVFVNDRVQSGSTCPPTVAPGGGNGTLYTCTGSGALYNWLGTTWNLISTGTSDISGSIAITEVAVGSGADTIGGSADLTSSGGADFTIGQESSIPAAFQNWWPDGAFNLFNNNNLLTGVKILSRGIDNDVTFGSALNVLSFAEADGELANGIWVSSWRHGAGASSNVFGVYVNDLTSVNADLMITFEGTIDIGLFSAPNVTVTTAYNYKTTNTLYGTLTTGYGFKDSAFIIGGAGGAEAISTWYSFHADDLNTGHITNPHYLWFDSSGVLEVREVSSQAVMGLHNPGFTKYTPGLANYERCIPGCQWSSNVADVGTENGGGGTLRNLRFIGQDVIPNPTGFFFLHQTVVTAAPAAGDCDGAGETNRVVYDSTNDNLYVCSGASGWRKITTAAP